MRAASEAARGHEGGGLVGLLPFGEVEDLHAPRHHGVRRQLGHELAHRLAHVGLESGRLDVGRGTEVLTFGRAQRARLQQR